MSKQEQEQEQEQEEQESYSYRRGFKAHEINNDVYFNVLVKCFSHIYAYKSPNL